MKKLYCFTLLAILAMTTDAFSAPAACIEPVSIASGNSSRSLPVIASSGCSPITFAQGITHVTIPYPVTVKEGVTLNGGSQVTITAASGFTQPSAAILTLKGGAVLQNVTVTHAGSLAVLLMGSNITVQNSKIADAAIGIKIPTGHYNKLAQNIFSNITGEAIELTGSGNDNISDADLTATMTSPNSWELTGDSSVALASVEIYSSFDDTTFSPLPTGAGFTEEMFVQSFDLNQTDPRGGFSSLITDNKNNSSELSDRIVPIESAGFFASFPDCNVEWFKQGLWNGDFDGDGLTNAAEDKNQNCIVEEGECDPADPASKCEVIAEPPEPMPEPEPAPTVPPEEPTTNSTTPSETPPGETPTDAGAPAEEEGGGCAVIPGNAADPVVMLLLLTGLARILSCAVPRQRIAGKGCPTLASLRGHSA